MNKEVLNNSFIIPTNIAIVSYAYIQRVKRDLRREVVEKIYDGEL
jgi:hypothetical protein